MVDVNAEEFAEQAVQILRIILRVVGSSTVPD